MRSATSLGAHLREASGARSKAEFLGKLHVAVQEADEAQFRVELVARSDRGDREELRQLHADADELIAILTTISRNVDRQD